MHPLRLTSLLLAPLALAISALPAIAIDLLPVDHSLRYVGTDEGRPVTVEITLRERLGGELDYVEWVEPHDDDAREPRVTRVRLAYRDETLVPLGVDTGEGLQAPPPALLPGALDALSVRLRARADIARGLRRAEYQVWNGEVLEKWLLEVSGAEKITTPDANYESLRFRLGSDREWIEGWSAPLLLFHFVRIDDWREGQRVGTLALEAKQL